MKDFSRPLIIMIMMFSFFMFTSCRNKPLPNDSQFKNIMCITKNPTQFEKLELALYEKEEVIAQNGNPFDYRYFKVVGDFIAPSGKKITMPAFWYQHADIFLNENDKTIPNGISGQASVNPNEPQGREVVTSVGNPHYRFRILPDEPGIWTYELKAYEKEKLVETITGEVSIAKSNKQFKGNILVDKSNNRTFQFASGESFIPVGQNLAWYTSSTRKSVDYEVWFEKMNEAGMNIARIWLAPWGFALHDGTFYDNFSSRYAALTRLDRVIDLASEFEIKLMLVLINHGQFSSFVNPTWNDNPWNIVNKGPLEHPIQFFSSVEAKETYKNQLLYLIARYGYSDSLMCWELFNEVDYVDGATVGTIVIKNWHDEMAKFLKANDPYQHMVTTSYKASTGAAFSLDAIDFACPHSYDYAERSILNLLPAVINSVYNQYKKPVLQAELGVNWQNGASSHAADPNGFSIHQGLWAAMMGGAAGGAMNWWWDSQIHPNNLYSLFKGAAIFSSKLNLSGSDYCLITDIPAITTSNSLTRISGYCFDNRIYGYLYDSSWTYRNYENILNKTTSVRIPFSNGTYQVKYFNPATGEEIANEVVKAVNWLIEITTPTFRYDLAFIIE